LEKQFTNNQTLHEVIADNFSMLFDEDQNAKIHIFQEIDKFNLSIKKYRKPDHQSMLV
jgi:hypothetical protein